MNDCIVAIASSTINSFHHIIRASGKDALAIVKKIFKVNLESIDNTTKKSLVVHNGLFTIYIFNEPYSYTGENMFEIHIWGNYLQAYRLLTKLLENGARLAKEGEFTKIAFLNGKKNFIELEQLATIFESTSPDIIKINNSILESKLIENKLKEIYDKLLNVISELEATWDFVEYDIAPVNIEKLLIELEGIHYNLNTILKNLHPYSNSSSYKIAIWGLPNVGKSLIFKRLTGYNSIISPIAGTTRDIISATKTYNNITFTFLDLPGYNIVFKNEIEKYHQKLINNILPNISGVVYVFDLSSEQQTDLEWECFKKVRNKILLAIGNKSDIQNKEKVTLLSKNIGEDFVIISALKNKGFGKLLNKLSLRLTKKKCTPPLNIISSRQFQLLEEIKSSTEKAISGLKENTSPDLITDDLKYSLQNLESLFGIRIEEEILSNIMSKFCIGK